MAEPPNRRRVDVPSEAVDASLWPFPNAPTPAERKSILARMEQMEKHRLQRDEDEWARRIVKEDRAFWVLVPSIGLCFFGCLGASFWAGDPETRRWAQSLTLAIVSGVGSFTLGKKLKD